MTKVKTSPAAAEPDAAAPASPDAPTDTVDTADTAPAEADKPAYDEAALKDLLKRMGLKKAWIEPSGKPGFDEKHLRHFHGDKFDSLTVISAE